MKSMIMVFDVSDKNFLENFLIDHCAEKAEDFKEEDTKSNEIKRVLSTLGVDKRDELNSLLLEKIYKSQEIKEKIGKKHPKKKGVALYNISGSFLEIFINKLGMYELTPRSGLNALVIINRAKEKKQKKDSHDVLEYRDGELYFLIAGGAGESLISNINELAKNIDITIPAHLQWTYKERKAIEKEAAENLQEVYEDHKKEKNKKSV